MAVPKHERGKTRTEFFDQLYRMHDALVEMMCRDFGIRGSTRDLKTFAYRARMSQEDKERFSELCVKYQIDVEVSYPSWLVDYYRESMLRTLDELMKMVTMANSVYVDVKSPNAMNEFKLRRELQWRAIGLCETLLQTLQNAARVLNRLCGVDLQTYMPIVELITRESSALREWKKSGNAILSAIQENTKS